MKSDLNFNTYQSAFSWRYGSGEMREIFSETNKRKTWRKVWVALALTQHKAGLISKAEYEDIKKNSGKIDIEKAHEIEKEIYHDLMAEIKVFAAQSKVGGGKIHLGATSMDIEDNADVIRIMDATRIIEKKLTTIIKTFSKKIGLYKNTVCMGYTHLQPAEPTTLGYRFSLYTQDLLNDLAHLREFKNNLKGKGFKGAVGTSASYEKLLIGKKLNSEQLSELTSKNLGIKEVLVSGQTYPRKTDLHLTYVLASIAQSLNKFCLDLRIMQAPNFGEWSEEIDAKRVGSSAMPFKRNPDKAEKVCSLARYISAFTSIAWENAANSIFERTLDDSANRRIFIPESFLACDEILTVSNSLIEKLKINEKNIKKNLENFGPFAGTESVMMEAVKNGASRQEIHEVIRKISMDAWQKINQSQTNPLVNLLKNDKIITKFVKKESIPQLLNPANHIGLARRKCDHVIREVEKQIK